MGGEGGELFVLSSFLTRISGISVFGLYFFQKIWGLCYFILKCVIFLKNAGLKCECKFQKINNKILHKLKPSLNFKTGRNKQTKKKKK
jgi:hypothetical protein